MASLGISSRLADIQPFHVMSLLARARELEAQGRDIVHMEIGEPDFQTPDAITQAGIAALKGGKTSYTPATGLPELRQAIAAYYQSRYGVNILAEQVVVTPGSSGALQLVIGLLLDESRSILLTDPGYPCNRNIVRFVGGKQINVPVDEATGYQLTGNLIEQYWQQNSIAALIASPSNPTGTTVGKQQLEDIYNSVNARGGFLVADEIYHGLEYTAEPLPTAAAVGQNVFVINSFSKYFGMTGWRIGWLIAPVRLIPELNKLAQNLFLAASTPAQWAALAAFTPECMQELESRKEMFRERRDYLYTALQESGFDIRIKPEGAFYLYANCRFTGMRSEDLASRLLEEVGVAVTPGKDFATDGAQDYLRFAYTTDISRLQTGIERIREFLNKSV